MNNRRTAAASIVSEPVDEGLGERPEDLPDEIVLDDPKGIRWRSHLAKHCLCQCYLWTRWLICSHKKMSAAVFGFMFLVIFVAHRHHHRLHPRQQQHNDLLTTTRPMPKHHCTFRKYRRFWCPTEPVKGAYQSCLLDLIFDAIGTTNKEFVEIVQFPENSTITTASNGNNHHRRQLRNGQRQSLLDLITAPEHSVKLADSNGNNETATPPHHLLQKGFTGVSFHSQPSLNPENAHSKKDNYLVSESTVAQKLNKAHVPIDVDYISIHTHAHDLWLLHGLLHGGYRPRVLSVEFNSNYPLDMFLSVDRTFDPLAVLHNDTVLYSASAAALNHVAGQYDYHVVEIMMSKLDMFFVRKDVLSKACSNYEFLDSFQSLGLVPRLLGYPHHTTCDVPTAREHVVDVPLMMAGRHEEAVAMAHVNIEELNIRRAEAKFPHFCHQFSG